SSDVLVPLIPHKVLSLEQALEFCREDECVEVTPANVRLRKVELSMSEREKYRGRRAKAAREEQLRSGNVSGVSRADRAGWGACRELGAPAPAARRPAVPVPCRP